MRREVAKEAAERTKLEAAIEMIKLGKLSSEEIAAVLKLPHETIQSLIGTVSA